MLRYFPTRLEFVSNQITALQRTQVPLGVMGGLALIWASLGILQRDQLGRQQRLARRASAQLPQTQARRVPDAGRRVRSAGVDAGRVQREPGGGRVVVRDGRRAVPVADGAAKLRRELGGDVRR